MSILTPPRRIVKPSFSVLFDSAHVERLKIFAAPLVVTPPARPDATARFLAARARVEARGDAAQRTTSGPATMRAVAAKAVEQIGRLRAAAGRAGADRKVIMSTSTVAPATLTIADKSYDVEKLPDGPDGEKVVRLSAHHSAAGVYDVSRGNDGLVRCDCPHYTFRLEGTTALCKHGDAVVRAGMIGAPAPVVNRANWHGIDGIPAAVSRIRLVGSLQADGTFRRDGQGWARESDGRRITGPVADREYVGGRVAILADDPATTPTPEPVDEGDVEGDPSTWPAWTDERWTTPEPAPCPAPRGFSPAPTDAAWWLGFALHAAGCVGEPCAGWPADVRASFLDGATAGVRQFDFDMDEEQARWATCEAEADERLASASAW
jgi:hypothetical protein